MHQEVVEVYKKLFDREAPEIPEWQAVEQVLDSFGVPKIGEELAENFLMIVINHVDFPNREVQNKLVGRAEGLIGELREDLSDEVHMAEVDRLEYIKNLKKRAR